MKIKTMTLPYDEVLKQDKAIHKNPKKPLGILSLIVRIIAAGDLKDTNFTYDFIDKENIDEGPYLILMNHSSFIDLEMASVIFKKNPYNIVCTSDGFVGKEGLMRHLGCIPTNKFVPDISLIKDMKYALNTLKTSVLMYPEASYTFDGCATPLQRDFGKLIKLLNVPVLMVKTFGAFHRDPLYNCLQKRKVKVSAIVSQILSKKDLKEKPVCEIEDVINKQFTFDSFKWQKENNIKINEPFRADGLERILYKCPDCGAEGQTVGKGINFICNNCKKEYTLTPLGEIKALKGDTKFSHIPDWYSWERNCIKKELQEKTYLLDIDVSIGVLVNYKAIYMVGEGHLTHTIDGFKLTGCDGKLHYEQKPLSSYSLYSDYYWYELGDIICIGTKDILYYCFPKKDGVVAKTRIATEELYKMCKDKINQESRD